MSPGQAADILSILPLPEAEAIMKSMAKENVLKIDEILRQHHENIVNFSTRKFLSYPPDETFSQAHESYLQAAEGQIVVTYLHIIDSTEKLLGVIDIKELLQAPLKTTTRLENIMITNVMTP